VRFLTHTQGAELLFAAGLVPAHPADVVDRIVEQLKAHGGDPAHFADELTQEYARHPVSAAAHMTACLAAFTGDVQVPDWPERGADGHLYTGLGGGDVED
jgi:hypothetical protein